MLALVRAPAGPPDLRTGLLTNNARELRALWWDLLPYDELFDDVVDSSDVGLRKPNPAIYRLALDRLGATAHRTAFLDDIASNVDAAERVGMRSVLVEPGGLEAIATVRELAAPRLTVPMMRGRLMAWPPPRCSGRIPLRRPAGRHRPPARWRRS